MTSKPSPLSPYSYDDRRARSPRTVPIVTLTLALFITVIQILRLSGGSYDDIVATNLTVAGWESFYNQPWRILTSSFVHQDLPHFANNLLFLLLFGRQIEQTHGPAYVLGIFFGAMVSSYVIFITVMHNWLMGLSGAVCGLFGFSLIANRRVPWWTTLTHRPLHILYMMNLLASVIMDIADLVPYPIAHLVHFTGILYGMAFAGAFLWTPRRSLVRGVLVALPILLFASQLYSPWQTEWQIVQRQPLLVTAVVDCRLTSATGDTDVVTTTTFLNASTTKRVGLYWLDYEGDARLWRWLKPGESSALNTLLGEAWCVVDLDRREALQAITVTEPEQTITIR